MKQMKKSYVVTLGVLALLLCASLPITVSASELFVRLPTQYVTMRVMQDTASYFEMTLFAIPAGYDITNGLYPGWCVQRDKSMTRGVNHTTRLYSSYDAAMPVYFQSPNWDKVNYLINHKQGSSKGSIQNAIWYFVCNYDVPSNDTEAYALIAATNAADNVSSFVPQPGENIAILADIINGNFSIQRTFIELQLPATVILGDLVWHDVDADGIQDAGEPGIPGITVSLNTQNGTQVDSVVTDVHGYYSFGYFNTGEYYIECILPQGYHFSPKDRGADDAKDSDVNPSTGRTDIMVFNASQHDTSWDAGMYVPISPGSPDVPVPQEVPNHPPTADGTAGIPYRGFIDEELRFNGSRSYDQDGRIVSWVWEFGDGTTANGSVVTHSYSVAGTYAVQLTVTDDDGATDTYYTSALIKVPNRAPLTPTISGPLEGNRNVSYVFTVVTTDPDNDNVAYTIMWGDGSQNTSPSVKSGQSIETVHQWNSLGFYPIRVTAQDPSNTTSETYEVLMMIDVRYVGSLGYLMNTDGIGWFEMFYSNQTGNITAVQHLSTGEYLLDTDGNGAVDYQYNPASGSFQSYSATGGPEYMMLLVGMAVVFVFILLIALFMRWRKKSKE